MEVLHGLKQDYQTLNISENQKYFIDFLDRFFPQMTVV